MSVNTEFWFGCEDGIESRFLDSIGPFRDWYEELATDPGSGYCIDLHETITRIVDSGRRALFPATQQQAGVLDAILDLFLGEYCDGGAGQNLFPPVNQSMLPTRYYESLLAPAQNLGEPHLIEFWNFLLSGRPLARDPVCFPYTPSNGVFRVSFVTAKEATALIEPIRTLDPSLGQGLSEAEISGLHWARDAIEKVTDSGVGLVMTAA